jgi:site-specific DNA-cytosine methylase
VRYLSVCSGIEAASVAWHSLGWQPLAFSEIEPFPRAVLAHHYPDVPLHGDFTVLRDQEWIADADVLVGGTPCQAFSVAGLRNSLSDERGNLSLEFVRLADAIDTVRLAGKRDAAIIVWENVPGVLSVKDNAFGCFLAALAGDVTPIDPPRGKWSNAGVVAGPQRTVAWRVLDAQYFGLAQRRRRVFVIASARDGFDPAAVLLEWEGVRRDTAPRREAGQAASGGTTGRAGERSHWDGDFPHPTLNQSAKGSGGVGASNQELFSQRGAYLAPAHPVVMAHGQANAEIRTDGGTPALTCLHEAPIVAHTLKGEGFDASEDGTGRDKPLVPISFGAQMSVPQVDFDLNQTLQAKNPMAVAVTVPDVAGTMKSCAQSGGWSNSADHAAAGYMVPVQVSHTLQTQCGFATEDGTGRGSPLVPVMQTPFSVCPDHCGGDKSGQDVAFVTEIDVSRTLDCTGADVTRKQGGVGIAIAFSSKDHGADATEDLSPTLRAMPHNHSHANGGGQMAVAVPLQEVGKRTGASTDDPRAGIGIGQDGDPMFTLQASAQHGVAAFHENQRAEITMNDTAGSLKVGGGKPGQGYPAVMQHMAVRRLTPVECERLQGFPDDYTMIPWKKKPADQCPDGPRYKALGNSMAVPVMRWIGARIKKHLEGQL